jgi:hypothetical protein
MMQLKGETVGRDFLPSFQVLCILDLEIRVIESSIAVYIE